MSALFQSGLQLGECQVDPLAGQIVRPDGYYHVAPKAMEILLCLVSRPDELVDRETLIEAGWGGGEHHEDALTRCIAELRHALGDHYDEPRYIQTVPRRGYRLVATVEIPQADIENGEERGLWHELKRRDVVRTGLAYAALAWLLIEVASVMAGIFDLPTWVLRVIVILAVIGLPITVALSWAIQRTPEGFALDMPVVAGSPGPTPMSARRVDMIIIGALLVAVAILLYREFSVPGNGVAIAPENTIAVLPFDNLSDKEEDEYIGDGLAEEVLNLLAQTEDLAVTSRKASFYYKNKDVPLPEIIAALRVRNIVEGSVQRSGDRVRVTVQLIDGLSLAHRWSESYDTVTQDMLIIRDTVAREVASELKTVMTQRGEAVIARDALVDRRVVPLYLQAREELRKVHSEETLMKARALLEQAIAIDDDYARSYAALCDTYLAWYVQSGRQQSYYDSASSACNQAIMLDSEQVEVYVALGNLYRESGALAEAHFEFDRALEHSAASYDAVWGKAQTLEASGDLAGAEALYRRLTELQPGYWHGYNALGHFLYGNGRYAEAIFNFRRVTELTPDNALAYNNLGAANYMRGNYIGAADAWERSVLIEPSNLVLSNIGLAAYYGGAYSKAEEMQVRALHETPEDFRLWGRLGDARRQLGDHEGAMQAYGNAVQFASRAIERNPANEEALRYLSLYYTHTGGYDAAIQAIEQARALRPDSSRVQYFAAKVYLGAGDPERALAELTQALEAGYPPQIAMADPDLEPLRASGLIEFEDGGDRSEVL